MDGFDWVDRGRGILTKRDREFLLGDLDDELNDNERYQKRYQIRQRVRDAMFDFHLLYAALSPRDIDMLWDETDDWIARSRAQRRRGDAPPYPAVPLLGRCWRDLFALFVYAQIRTGVPEAEALVEWAVEEGIDEAVRRHTLESHDVYREADSTLEWGTGGVYVPMDYLRHIGRRLPEDPDEARERLLELQREEFLQRHHAECVYRTYVGPEGRSTDRAEWR